ncbi:MAG: tetratricopeptide repeat protein [Candidatus Eremiobacteraeota bacterium]|nr:tetratricopeptide repeat protein [Candidatus Eremiobacteraeota bacterium]MCW5867812.1 tetratricopeptide repeat protein [Candidatus Eremiobacteraeota bacterium]
MRKQLVSLGVLLMLAGVSQAVPRAMVLAVQGKVVSGKTPVLTGQLLDDASRLELPGDSSLTLLLLNQGQRLAIRGKGKLDINEQGVKVREGATLHVIDSNQEKLSLNGENHRAIGGVVTRDGEIGSTDLASTAIDKVEVREGEGLVISRPAGPGSPPPLCFHYTVRYKVPEVTKEGKATCLLPSADQRIWSPVIAGQQVGSRWQWEVGFPKEDYKSMGLVVTPKDEDSAPVLYTWVYQASPQEEDELRALARQTRDWTRREPGSIEPLVLYASLLEDRGYLEQANQQLDRALALEKAEPGLLQMKARVLTELGRYAEAGSFLAR